MQRFQVGVISLNGVKRKRERGRNEISRVGATETIIILDKSTVEVMVKYDSNTYSFRLISKPPMKSLASLETASKASSSRS